MPDFELELTEGGQIAGVDEVGRGPWAGPVFAAAVILSPVHFPPSLCPLIKDSKKLNKLQREKIFDELTILPPPQFIYGLGSASVDEIDSYNIHHATLLAMKRALIALPIRPTKAIIDGKFSPEMPFPCQSIVGGDDKSLSIAAASIIAKVTRDRLMTGLSETYPHYGWQTNAGYGTKQHQEAILRHGITSHHRKSFAPIAQWASVNNILSAHDG